MAGPVPVLLNGMGARSGIWDMGPTQHHEIGTRATLPDGRVFYYARNSGAAIVAGNLLTQEVMSAQFEGLAVNTAAAGDTTLSITLGTIAVTAQEYIDGYVVVHENTGEGITYKIRSHPAVAASAEGVFTLIDPIHVGFAAATEVCLVKNPWADVVIAPAGQAHVPAGVSNVAVDAGTTDQQYFWCQTWGVASVWQDEATAIGSIVTSGTTAGQVEAQDLVAECIVGHQIFTGTATENQPVFLSIAP